MQFMAIEVLQRNRYTYRHRLESFSRPYLDVHSSHSRWMTRSWPSHQAKRQAELSPGRFTEAPLVVWRGSFEQGSRTGPCPLTMAHLLGLTAQPGSPTAQAIAATAQVQRRKWKLLMSRFRYRTTCYQTGGKDERINVDDADVDVDDADVDVDDADVDVDDADVDVDDADVQDTMPSMYRMLTQVQVHDADVDVDDADVDDSDVDVDDADVDNSDVDVDVDEDVDHADVQVCIMGGMDSADLDSMLLVSSGYQPCLLGEDIQVHDAKHVPDADVGVHDADLRT
ncbi:unnamed protein product [Sphagnum balticum]